jgi:hypothetical protein
MTNTKLVYIASKLRNLIKADYTDTYFAKVNEMLAEYGPEKVSKLLGKINKITTDPRNNKIFEIVLTPYWETKLEETAVWLQKDPSSGKYTIEV